MNVSPVGTCLLVAALILGFAVVPWAGVGLAVIVAAFETWIASDGAGLG